MVMVGNLERPLIQNGGVWDGTHSIHGPFLCFFCLYIVGDLFLPIRIPWDKHLPFFLNHSLGAQNAVFSGAHTSTKGVNKAQVAIFYQAIHQGGYKVL